MVVFSLEQEPQECLAWVWPLTNQIFDAQRGFETVSLEYPDCDPEILNLATGVQMGIVEGQLTITAVMVDSPAEKSGIQENDQILAINEESTADKSVRAAASKIRGKKNSTVDLLIRHAAQSEPQVVTVDRGVMDPASDSR